MCKSAERELMIYLDFLDRERRLVAALLGFRTESGVFVPEMDEVNGLHHIPELRASAVLDVAEVAR